MPSNPPASPPDPSADRPPPEAPEPASGNVAKLRAGLLSVGALVLAGLIAWATSYLPTRFFEQGDQDELPPIAVDVRRGPVRTDSGWDDCRGYVIPRDPATIPPPPPIGTGVVEARRRWAEALGGADAGSSMIVVTVQGRSARSVVLQGLRVRVVARRPPPGGATVAAACGGPLSVRLVSVDLDRSPPAVVGTAMPDGDPAAAKELTPVRFPYVVSETDPEQFAIEASTKRCDCSWTAELLWVDRGRPGVTRIDDGGEPFRTIATRNAPTYLSANGEALVRR
jgi:hypothetical protein